MQLVLRPELGAKARPLLGRRVALSGGLFGGHTPHLFTKVLLFVRVLNGAQRKSAHRSGAQAKMEPVIFLGSSAGKVMGKLLAAVVVASLCVLASAQTSTIEQIEAKVRQIDAESKKYARTQHTFYEETSEGGQMTFYAAGKELKKAIVEAYGETGKSRTELYYAQGELIFASRTTVGYKTPISVGPQLQIASTHNERFYFAGGKLLRRAPNLKPGVEESARQILSLSQKVRRAFAERPR